MPDRFRVYRGTAADDEEEFFALLAESGEPPRAD
jgi:hypothetical protein